MLFAKGFYTFDFYLIMIYFYVKALHIIFIVTWFAGLFYIVRLFVYHAEAAKKAEPEKTILQNQFKIMEKRLWYGITWPSMILTYIFGFWTAYSLFGFDYPDWLLIKILFVIGITGYHVFCQLLFSSFQKDIIARGSTWLRMWNEVATLFLVAIVFLVVLKQLTDFAWGVAGFVVFSALLFAAIHFYKKIRQKGSD
jgi:protoporphyrinogen IX oxidase